MDERFTGVNNTGGEALEQQNNEEFQRDTVSVIAENMDLMDERERKIERIEKNRREYENALGAMEKARGFYASDEFKDGLDKIRNERIRENALKRNEEIVEGEKALTMAFYAEQGMELIDDPDLKAEWVGDVAMDPQMQTSTAVSLMAMEDLERGKNINDVVETVRAFSRANPGYAKMTVPLTVAKYSSRGQEFAKAGGISDITEGDFQVDGVFRNADGGLREF